MRTLVMFAFVCAAVVLCMITAATAELSDPVYGGDPVVYDENIYL